MNFVLSSDLFPSNSMSRLIIVKNTKFLYYFLYLEPFQEGNFKVDSWSFSFNSRYALEYQSNKAKNKHRRNITNKLFQFCWFIGKRLYICPMLPKCIDLEQYFLWRYRSKMSNEAFQKESWLKNKYSRVCQFYWSMRQSSYSFVKRIILISNDLSAT